MKKITLLTALFLLLLFLGACKKQEKSAKQSTKQPLVFNYSPTKPVNGTLKGAIELGASGFNAFIINVDKDKNWEVKSREFGSSLFIEGMTNANEINEKLKEHITKMVEYGVIPKNIYFVMSSGAKKSEIASLVIPKLKSIGHKVHEVTAEQEGIYALKAALPKQFKNKAFVVDIGSGNTKISYFKNNTIVAKETYGSKYFQKGSTAAEVYKEVTSIATNIPKEKREMCFIIGGVPYNMAKILREKEQRFTMLPTAMSTYENLVKNKGKKVESGLNIFKAIANETKCNQFVFDWDANFTIGFLVSTNDNK